MPGKQWVKSRIRTYILEVIRKTTSLLKRPEADEYQILGAPGSMFPERRYLKKEFHRTLQRADL
jgi:hypothetical protein